MEEAELSAFQAYNLSKKKKKTKKKVLNISKEPKNGDNVPQGFKPVAHSKTKSDYIWDDFLNDLQGKKIKTITASTPTATIPLQNVFALNGSGESKERKRKRKFTALSVNGGDDGDINALCGKPAKNCKVEEQVCAAGHFLKGKLVCKKCKRLEDYEKGSPGQGKKKGKSTFFMPENVVKDSVDETPEERSPDVPPKVTEKKKKKKHSFSVVEGNNFNDPEKLGNQSTEILPVEKKKAAKSLKAKNINLDEESSVNQGKKMLEWILSPVNVDQFFKEHWEKKPLHIDRSCPGYFDGIFSTEDLDRALRQSLMYFGKNVDVTAYENGVRTTENPEGRARPAMVWEKYRQGRSIRVLNPQTFIPNVGIMVSTLQEFFRCMVGVNSYLTPAGTQGFAPHFDDIEAFVLQLEGEKLWKVYPPRNEGETLPRFSSPNYSQEEIGEPILEVHLKPGDLLYFPRGFIHQARSVDNHHSLHITVSTYQCNTWGDLLQKAIPAALDLARDEIVDLREGLPLNFLDHFGAVYSDSESPERSKMLQRLGELARKVIEACPWDAAADQIGKQFIHDTFPPTVPDVPQNESWEKWFRKPRVSDVAVKLATANCIRMVLEEEALMVYYNTDNSKEYRGEEPQCFEIMAECGPIVENLLVSYPNYTKLKDLPRGEPINTTLFKKLLKQLFSHSLLLVKNNT